MLNPRLASRYAKSLIDLAIEKGQLEAVYNDIVLLQGVVKNREFANLLRSPIISSDKKQKVLQAVTEGKVSAITAGFNRLIIEKNREAVLPEVIKAFIEQYKVHKNIHTAKLVTAVPVSDEVKNAIISQIKKTVALQNVELETSVNEDLIGGFTLQVGDQLVDASISKDLREIARQFENNDFIYKVR